jgi:hypothetical protein
MSIEQTDTFTINNGYNVQRKMFMFIDFEDVLEYIGFNEDEKDAIYDYVFSQHMSAEYVAYTIVRNHDALEGITSAMWSYYREVADMADEYKQLTRSVPTPTFTTDEIRTKFWEIVRDGEFINLEN